jgi:hypothetical protein
VRSSFSALSLYAECPVKYRLLQVRRLPEPAVEPDWRSAPRAQRLTVASQFDRDLGRAAHAGLASWQRLVDGGQAPQARTLLAAVRRAAARMKLEPARLERALGELTPGLTAYAQGPWPLRQTVWVEHRLKHGLVDHDGFRLELSLRVDRVARFRGGVAVLDFKTVPPHPFQARADRWQLQTYALAVPPVLGVTPGRVQLFVLDLRGGREVSIPATGAALAGARAELLTCAHAIAAGRFEVGAEHPDRPCWCCGFRLTCTASLATEPPHRLGSQPG